MCRSALDRDFSRCLADAFLPSNGDILPTVEAVQGGPDTRPITVPMRTLLEVSHGIPYQKVWAPAMETTIDISTDLAVRAKALAAKRGVTLRTVVEQGLRMALEEDQGAKGFRLPNRSVPGRGLRREYASRPWSDIVQASYGGRGS